MKISTPKNKIGTHFKIWSIFGGIQSAEKLFKKI